MFKFKSKSNAYKTIVFDTIRIFMGMYTWYDLEKDEHPNSIVVLTEGSQVTVSVAHYQKKEKTDISNSNNVKRIIKKLLYQIIDENFIPIQNDWGILTGIRPTKIINRKIDQGFTREQVIEYLKKDFLVSPQKASLVTDIALRQRDYFLSKDDMYKKVSLYVAIPFCPSICQYCTFGSYHHFKYRNRVDQYLSSLQKEIEEVLIVLKRSGMIIDTIYIGGGTPSVLTASQLRGLLGTIDRYINKSDILEYTFEAGRPETIDLEKLSLLKEYGINRLSVNPQIMDDHVLKAIGREHGVQDIYDAVKLAKEEGFPTLNMDLILGIEDNEEQYFSSLRKVIAINPENITIHSLAYKRKSSLSLDPLKLKAADRKEIFDETIVELINNDYVPYYLYKQKLTVAGQENIGFAKKDHFSRYNIQMIEERQIIFGFGLGASSKLLNPKDLTLENVFNSKDLIHYTETITEAIDKKKNYIEKICREYRDGDQKT